MTTTEQRVARAINATAQQITADSIPPFRVAEAGPRFVGRKLPGPRSWPRMLAPVAVAAAVVLVAGTAAVIGNDVARHRPRVDGLSGQVPPYYAALRYEHPFTAHVRTDVTIRSTATGKVLATVPSPAAHFVPLAVSAAADDRRFVLAAVKSLPSTSNSLVAPVRFYLLRFNPATDSVAVSPLPISGVTANGSDGVFQIALSPDGRSLAVVTDTFSGIRAYSLPTGAQHTWTLPGTNLLLAPAWAGHSRMLAFFIRPLDVPAGTTGVRLLDTASHSHNLLSASHIPPVLHRYECGPAWFVPRPSMIVCVIEQLHKEGIRTAYVAEVSLRTGKLLRRLPLPGTVPGDLPPQVAWANPAGTKVIVIKSQSRPRPSGSASAYLVTSGQVTKIPGATWAGAVNIYLPASW